MTFTMNPYRLGIVTLILLGFLSMIIGWFLGVAVAWGTVLVFTLFATGEEKP